MKVNEVEHGVLSSYLSTVYFYSAHNSTTLYMSKLFDISSGKTLPTLYAFFSHALGYLEEGFSVPLADTTWWKDVAVSSDYGLDRKYVTPNTRLENTDSNTAHLSSHVFPQFCLHWPICLRVHTHTNPSYLTTVLHGSPLETLDVQSTQVDIFLRAGVHVVIC
jgi:hypothetical protein